MIIKNYNTILKICSFYFFFFSIQLFLSIFLTLTNKSTQFFGLNLSLRNPSGWDFEIIFAAIYLIWAVFLWMSSSNLKKNITFIKFSGYSTVIHALSLILIGVLRNELSHLIPDSIPFLLIGLVLINISYDKN